MKSVLRIIRPLNLFIIAATMLVVLIKYRNEQNEEYWKDVLFLVLPAVLTAAAGYIVNDIFDVVTDKINKPGKVIIGNGLAVRRAWLMYAILNVISLLCSYMFGEQYLIINTCIIGLLYLYALQLKGMPLIGNMIVALCSATVIASCVLVTTFDTWPAKLNFFGYIIFAFFVTLIRELVKDMQDMEGDRVAQLRTYPIVAGVKGAKIIVYALCTMVIMFCGLYSFLAWGLDLYISSMTMAIITISFFYVINHISKGKTSEEFGESSKLLKYVILAGVINLIFS